MPMTREDAIRSYIQNLNGDDIADIMMNITAYDGTFEEQTWYDMEELDNLLCGHTPTEIVDMVGGDFTTNDDYFRFDGYGLLESGNDYMREHEALDYMEDIIEWCIDSSVGETGDYTLDNLIEADNAAMFDDDYEIAEEEEEEE